MFFAHPARQTKERARNETPFASHNYFDNFIALSVGASTIRVRNLLARLRFTQTPAALLGLMRRKQRGTPISSSQHLSA